MMYLSVVILIDPVYPWANSVDIEQIKYAFQFTD